MTERVIADVFGGKGSSASLVTIFPLEAAVVGVAVVVVVFDVDFLASVDSLLSVVVVSEA